MLHSMQEETYDAVLNNLSAIFFNKSEYTVLSCTTLYIIYGMNPLFDLWTHQEKYKESG